MTPRLRFVLRPSDVDPAEAGLPDDLVLRGAVVLVGLAAIRSLVVVDLLEPRTALLCGAATVGCSALARWTLTRPGLRWLRLAAWLAVGAVSVVHAVLDPLGRDPRLLLGMLVAGFVAATAAEQDGSRRSMLVNLALGLAVIALSAGVAPEASLVVPMALGWVGALVALLRTAPRRERLGTAAPLAPPSLPDVSRGTGGAVLALRAQVGPLVACVLVGLAAFALLQVVHPQDPYSGGGSGPFSTGSPGPGDPEGQRLATAFTGDTMDLRERGQLSDVELLEVPSSSPQLWRTGMLDTYTGSTWQSSRSGAATLLGRGTVRVPEDPIDPRPPDAASSASGPAPGQGWSVAVLDPRMTTVAVPGIATSVSVAIDPAGQRSPFGTVGVVRLLDGRLITVDGTVRPGRPPQVASVDAYTVGALARDDVATLTASSTAAAVPTGQDPGDPRETRWTQLPEHVPARVRDLAATLTAASSTRLDLVRAIETDLRTRARYTLDSPVPAEGQDAVDDFLFVSREGFCEQFASAEVVLLRAAGVPARVVVGFAGGQDEVGARILRGKDAHAWVEVWFPGRGWVTSDPTAGATAVERSSLDGILDAIARWWPLLVGLLVIVAAAVGWTIVRRRRARAAHPRPVMAAEVAALLAAFDRYERALAATGAGRRPDESLAQVASRTSDDGARSALATLERLTFAPRPPAPTECLAAAQALAAASDALREPAGASAR